MKNRRSSKVDAAYREVFQKANAKDNWGTAFKELKDMPLVTKRAKS